jgi:hypothetical protein
MKGMTKTCLLKPLTRTRFCMITLELHSAFLKCKMDYAVAMAENKEPVEASALRSGAGTPSSPRDERAPYAVGRSGPGWADKIPISLLLHVSEFLDGKSVARMSECCRGWRLNEKEAERLWRLLYIRDFGPGVSNVDKWSLSILH